MPSRVLWTLLLCFVLAFSLCPLLYGQSTYGSISGAVTDSTGAAIPGAQVTLTNMGTAQTQTQPSSSDGLYTFVNLIPGDYKIDIEKQGFKHFTRANVVVQVNQASKIDATMAVGQVSETVEVTSETPLLQPETSSLGQVVEQRKANELPLNGRNIYNLTAVAPSVIPQGNTTGSVVGKNPFDFANYQIGGSFANEGAEYLDGQPLNIGYINLPLLVPTQDSISEFKVQYNNLGPEWGKFAGGVINLSTKSGTNSWHGSAYEYLRNKVFNANEYFLKGSQIASHQSNTPPAFTQNQFGATIGGAIIKDKTFVFGSYEGFRLRQGSVFTTTVPTAAERQGQFADLCGSFTAGLCNDTDPKTGQRIHQLYDPLNVNPATGARAPILNNDLTALAYYPNPTSAYLLANYIPNPTNGNVLSNFVKAASTGGDIDEYVVRADQTISTRQHIFGRYSQWKLLSLAQDPFGTGLCKDRCAENTKSYSAAVGYNFAVTPTTIIDINLSASRFNYIRDPINQGFDVTKEGWPAAYNPLVPPLERTPLTPCFGNSDSLVTCSQGQSAIADHNTQWNLSPQVTMIRGKHTFNFGAQLEMGYDNYLQTNTGGGLISFTGAWTTDTAGGGGNSSNGKDFADFLLGFGNGQGSQFGNQTTGSLVISGPISGKQTYRAFYFGDNWKVTTKLTLNLGVRYELQGPWSERFNKMTYFNPKAVNASVTGCNGTPGSPCLGDLFLVGTGVNSGRNNLPLDKKQFLPRLGFAYGLNEKTVIRGGYGIFFIPNYVSFGTNPYIDPVSSSTNNFFASNDKGLTPSATLNQNGCTTSAPDTLTCTNQGPFGQNTDTLVPVPGRNPQPNVSQYILNQSNFSATGYTVQKYGYVQQYNLDIQRQLPAGFFMDIAYAGSHGVHLPQFNTNVNQIPDSFIHQAQQQSDAGQAVTIAQVIPTASYPFACPLCNPVNNLPGGLGQGVLTQGQLDRPYPQYAGLNLNGQGCCDSSYNSLQLTVTKRFQGGGTLLAAYTNAKLISNTDTLTSWLEGGVTGGVGAIQDWNNLSAERSLSSQDVSQRLVISYVLDLPFGKGKKYANSFTGFKNGVISGWGIDGVTTFQKGFPVKISMGSGNKLSGAGLGIGTLRPDAASGCDKKSVSGAGPHNLGEWFNTSCFVSPAAWSFGDEARVDPVLRQSGINNWDFALFKRTYFGPEDRMNIEFRAEFFDLFNRPQFGPPNGSCCSVPPAGSFGIVTNTINNPRLIQFGLKFAF